MTTREAYSVAAEEGFFTEDGEYCWFERYRERYKTPFPTKGEIYIANTMYDLVKEDPLRYFEKKIEEFFDGTVDIVTTCRKNGTILQWRAH
jgi:hypothetical protein